jgi:sulfur relay protein TusB/DsrH
VKLGLFVSDYKTTSEALRVKSDGLILVLNGVYHATIKEGGKPSDLLGRGGKLYALLEDLQTRGIAPEAVDKRVKVVDYNGLVDVIFNEFEKIAWI